MLDSTATDDAPAAGGAPHRRVCVDTYERLCGRSLYSKAPVEEQAAGDDAFATGPLFVGHLGAEQLMQLVELLDPYGYNRGSW
jgi:hypothetical protein